MLRFGAILIAVMLFVSGVAAWGLDRHSIEQWRYDLGAFRQAVPKLHKNPYHAISKSELDRLLDRLEYDLPRLSREEVIVRLGEIVARIGDGHSYLDYSADAVGFRQLPVRFYRFTDGLYIVAAHGNEAGLLGAQVITIGGYPAAEVFQRVARVVSGDNDSQLDWLTPLAMGIPEVLHGTHITRDLESIPLVVQKDGKEHLVALTPLNQRPVLAAWDVPPEWRMAADTRRLLWLQQPTVQFWMQPLEADRALYVQINGIYPKPEQSLASFFDAAASEAEKPAYDKLIVDLRLNTGGNSGFILPLIHRLIRSDKFARRGSLFVIIGRQTFSAAQNLVDQLETHTPAIFVGEPTAGSPNHFGDPEVFRLPRSDIPIRLATTWWQTAGPKDTRKWTAPEIFVQPRYADWSGGNDPALGAILSWTPESTLAGRVRAALQAGDAQKAKAAAREFMADPRSKFASAETELARLGEELASAGDSQLAIAVLLTATELFPQSAQAHDRLAETYLRAGQVANAIAEFEKALQLDPKDANARIMLRRLKR